MLFRSPRKYHENLFRDLAKIHWSSHRPRCLLSYQCDHCINLILNIFFIWEELISWIESVFYFYCLYLTTPVPREGRHHGLRSVQESLVRSSPTTGMENHDDVIKWKHFPRYWPYVRGIHRSPVNSPHKGQWRGALMFPLICARINGWVWWGWWYETLSCPLWRHGNANRVVCFSVTALPFACEANINAYDTLFNQLTLAGKHLNCNFIALIKLLYDFLCHRDRFFLLQDTFHEFDVDDSNTLNRSELRKAFKAVGEFTYKSNESSMEKNVECI